MNRRYFSLDILRGFACVLVVIGHLPTHYPEFTAINEAVDAWLGPLRKCAYLGVHLFFVLSGLLISGLLFNELKDSGKLDLKRFWLRRGMKIWPSFFAAYSLYVGFLLYLFGSQGNALEFGNICRQIVPNALFIQNYFHDIQWPCSWSVAVEEHFYLALPLLLLALIAVGRLRWLPGVALLVGVIDLCWRLGITVAGGESTDVKYPTHLNVDALLFGVLLGYGFAFYPQVMQRLRRTWPFALMAAFGVLAVASRQSLYQFPNAYAVAFTPAYLAFGWLVAVAWLFPDFGAKGSLLLRWPLEALGRIGVYSYTIYLMHGVVFVLPWPRALLSWSQHPAWAPAVFILGSIAAGVALSHAVERPVLKLRDRIIPSASGLRRKQAAQPAKALLETADFPTAAPRSAAALQRAAYAGS